jgi:hypothetical protein
MQCALRVFRMRYGAVHSVRLRAGAAHIDEVPGVFEDIHAVVAAQTNLVEVLGQIDPKLVKMCAAGDRAED